MKTAKKHLAILITIAIVISTMGLSVFAAGGDGSGGGTGAGDGGGKDRPLSVELTRPRNGGTISSGDTILFKFNKNIADDDIRENNASLFEMYDEDGNEVRFVAQIIPESQNREKRNDVVIRPTGKLAGGKTYTVTALPGIQSRSGHVLESSFSLTFEVEGTSSGGSTGGTTGGSSTTDSGSRTGGGGGGGAYVRDRESVKLDSPNVIASKGTAKAEKKANAVAGKVKDDTAMWDDFVKGVPGAAKKAAGAKAPYGVNRIVNPNILTVARAEEIAKTAKENGGKVIVYADCAAEKAVLVRLQLDPEKVEKDIKLGAAVNSERNKWFADFYQNNIQGITFAHQDDAGQDIEVAAKINLDEIDKDKLVFYSYDGVTGKYAKLENQDYTVDGNGYVHFVTPVLKDIIISEGELVKGAKVSEKEAVNK